MRNILLLIFFVSLLSSCNNKGKNSEVISETDSSHPINYDGTASITKGIAKTTIQDIYKCDKGRKTDVGEIISLDSKVWTVPARTNFQNDSFPLASNMHNACTGNIYSDAQMAYSKLDNNDVIVIDQDGELFTSYIFADNYFEMYINGVPVGKDPVPFTQFNSNIVQFKVNKPFTIAMKLVDWEEHLGIGCEANRGNSFHCGDGGMVATIKDSHDNIIATTNKDWKAQTFYTAPILDLSCTSEAGNYRYSSICDTHDNQDGSLFYALHWELPSDWMKSDFDDSYWPGATTYANETIGVDNKPSYTNFKEIFDEVTNDAQFIWSTNVVLDNEVLVRYKVE